MSNSDPLFPSYRPKAERAPAARSENISADLLALTQVVDAAAKSREGDCLALLKLLRILNELHSEIRDTLFREALPDNRQRLYRLLKDIEQEGGWPYIRRMKLTALLEQLKEEGEEIEAVGDRENNIKPE
ncbi:MAG: hypothetical protein WBA76_17155 [Phormidesmis sp.]